MTGSCSSSTLRGVIPSRLSDPENHHYQGNASERQGNTEHGGKTHRAGKPAAKYRRADQHRCQEGIGQADIGGPVLRRAKLQNNAERGSVIRRQISPEANECQQQTVGHSAPDRECICGPALVCPEN